MDCAVIIPLFNGAPWIGETLASVMAQTQRPTEILVIDDGSTDHSRQIIATFPGVQVLANPQKGAEAARQFGLESTEAPYVTFLDQDDIWHPRHLESLSQLLDTYPDASAAATQCRQFTALDTLSLSDPPIQALRFDPWILFPNNQIDCPAAVLIRRTALAAIGGWTTAYWGSSDAYMWFRLSTETAFVGRRGFTCGYRIHPTSMGMQLRRQKNLAYVEITERAYREAMTYRIISHPEQAASLQQQMNAFSRLHEIIQSLETSAPERLHASVTAVATDLAHQPDEFSKLLLQGTFWWFIKPYLSGVADAQQQEIVRTLVTGWPRDLRINRWLPFVFSQ